MFPKRSAKMIDGTVKPEIPLNLLQNAQRDTKNLAISRDFFGYSKLIFLFFALYHFMLPGNFYYQGTSSCMHKQKRQIDKVWHSNKIPFFYCQRRKGNSKDIIETSPNILCLWVLLLTVILLNNFASAKCILCLKNKICHPSLHTWTEDKLAKNEPISL